MMKRLWLIRYPILILLLAGVAGAQSYTTNFPLAENPISEGGKWINGGVVGLDWNNVATTTGFAYGTDPGQVDYAASWALLAGTWGQDQTVQATIKDHSPNSNCHQEHELILRGSLSAHVATGYEVTVRATNDSSSYLLIARLLAVHSQLRRGGGFYDHVSPQPTVSSDGIPPQDLRPGDVCTTGGQNSLTCDFNYTGYRVPLIVISPFTRKNYVSHPITDYTGNFQSLSKHASICRTSPSATPHRWT